MVISARVIEGVAVEVFSRTKDPRQQYTIGDPIDTDGFPLLLR
jgi:hypothetical protein